MLRYLQADPERDIYLLLRNRTSKMQCSLLTRMLADSKRASWYQYISWVKAASCNGFTRGTVQGEPTSRRIIGRVS